VTRREPLRGDAGERQAGELLHLEAGCFAEPVDLPVPSLAQHDPQVRHVAFHGEPRHLRGARRPSIDLDARAPARQIAIFDDAADLRDVHLRRLLAWMQQSEGELAVVGQQQRARRAEIEPSHRYDARAGAFQVFGDRRASSGIGHRADDVPRLVEDEIDERLAQDGTSVDFDPAAIGIGARAELRDDAPVHLDAPGDDEFLGLAPGRNASAGQDLLQPFECHDASAP
jgi:hypothetical protein